MTVKAADVIGMAEALSANATGGSNGNAYCYLLGLPLDEAKVVLEHAVRVAEERFKQSERTDVAEAIMMALLTGVEIGVAAEAVAKFGPVAA